MDQVVYTPPECGRSFDEDFVEGELNKFVLYSNRKSSSKGKIAELDNRLLSRQTGDELKEAESNTESSTKSSTESKNADDEHNSRIKNINKMLESLAERVDNEPVNPKNESRHYYSGNANLNLESLIKNFNLSTTNETDLQTLRSALTNRDEYYHYGEKRIINGKQLLHSVKFTESSPTRMFQLKCPNSNVLILMFQVGI